LLSDEISFEKPVDIHQQQKEVPTKPKQSLREHSLTLQPTMSSVSDTQRFGSVYTVCTHVTGTTYFACLPVYNIAHYSEANSSPKENEANKNRFCHEILYQFRQEMPEQSEQRNQVTDNKNLRKGGQSPIF
uniref:Ovule protein n=1 Tax=Haemonchus placei TaxID=6290 RepID=A0A0N4W1N5_HAEPC